jgi:hypothetical protein
MKQILAKLHAIMKDVEYIEKDAYSEHGKFRYASELAIKEAVGKAMRDHRVVLQFEDIGPPQIAEGASKSGPTSILFFPFKYTFWDVDSGESMSGVSWGTGHTRDDKGFYAAVTGGIKYTLTSNFLIPTGDDPESARHDSKNGERGAVDPQTGEIREPYKRKDELLEAIPKLESIVFESGVDRGNVRYAHNKKKSTDLSDFLRDELKTYHDDMIQAQKIEDNLATLIKRVEKGEAIVYPSKDVVRTARKKYLETEVLTEPTAALLKMYLVHLLQKAGQKQAA